MNHNSKRNIQDNQLFNRIAHESEIRRHTEAVLRSLDPSKKALARELNIQINASKKVNEYLKLHDIDQNYDVGDCDEPQVMDTKDFLYREVYHIKESITKLNLQKSHQSPFINNIGLLEEIRRNKQKLVYLKELLSDSQSNFVDKISNMSSTITTLKKEVSIRIIGVDTISRSFTLNSIMTGLPAIIKKSFNDANLRDNDENINAKVRCDLLLDGHVIFSTESRKPSMQCWNAKFNYLHDFRKVLEFQVFWLAPYRHLTDLIERQADRYRSLNFMLSAIGYLPLNDDLDHGFITRTVELYPGGRIFIDTYFEPSQKVIKSPRLKINGNSHTDSVDKHRSIIKSPSPLPGFKLCSLLGTGNFAKIILCQRTYDRRYYAVKLIKKMRVIEGDEFEQIISEKEVLKVVKEQNHPLLVHLFACLQDAVHIMFVLEFVQAGDLSTLIYNNGKFSYEQAQFYAASVVLCFEFLHHKKIMYRDLKLENLMLDSKGYIKLVDFGLCKLNMGRNDYTHTFCGTKDYMAPEILAKRYTRMVDWWALGVLLYCMLTGEVPFTPTSDEDRYQSIIYDRVTIPPFVNDTASSFIISLLNKNPNSRLGFRNGANEVKLHPYFSNINFQKLYERKEPAPFIPNLKYENDLSYFDRQFTDQKATLSFIEVDLSDNPDSKLFFDEFVKF